MMRGHALRVEMQRSAMWKAFAAVEEERLVPGRYS